VNRRESEGSLNRALCGSQALSLGKWHPDRFPPNTPRYRHGTTTANTSHEEVVAERGADHGAARRSVQRRTPIRENSIQEQLGLFK
jgi:hypothetical protein